jgi:hypothetical protein
VVVVKKKKKMSLLNIFNAICGFFVFIIPLWPLVFHQQKIKGNGIAIIIFGLFVLVLSLIKGCKDERSNHAAAIRDSTNGDRIEYLVKAHQTDSTIRITDSIEDRRFFMELFAKFNIVKDSSTNLPRRATTSDTYNTTIGSAGKVNIGPHIN